jgi:hypothetical protein
MHKCSHNYTYYAFKAVSIKGQVLFRCLQLNGSHKEENGDRYMSLFLLFKGFQDPVPDFTEANVVYSFQILAESPVSALTNNKIIPLYSRRKDFKHTLLNRSPKCFPF